MKKPKKKAKKTYKGPTLFDRLPSNRGEWLELCIKFTKRAVHNPPYKEDQWLFDQEAKLNKELAEWRKNGN